MANTTGKGDFPIRTTWAIRKYRGSLVPFVKTPFAGGEDTTYQVLFNDYFFPPLQINLPLISSSNILNNHTVTPGAVGVTLPLINDGNSLFAPTVALVQNVTLPLITDGDTLNTPTISVGAVTLMLPLISNTNTLSVPTITPGSVSLTLPLISDADTLSVPTITAGAVTLTLPLLSDSDTLFEPTITFGAITLDLPLISDSDSFYGMTISVAGGASPQNLTLPLITDTDSLFAPTVTPAVWQFVLPNISATSNLFAPNVAQPLLVPFRSSESIMYTPTIINYKTIELAYIQNVNTKNAPSLSYSIGMTLPFVTSGSLFAPQVLSVVNALLPLLSEEVIYIPTLTVGNVAMLLPIIESEQVYPLHSVKAQKRVYTGMSYVFETVV